MLEAADALLRNVGIEADTRLVRAGAMLHEAGKTLHPNELSRPGAHHEGTRSTLSMRTMTHCA